jgi:hypothetical protein
LKIQAFLCSSPNSGSFTNESNKIFVAPVIKSSSTIPISMIKPYSGFRAVVSISITAIFSESGFLAKSTMSRKMRNSSEGYDLE